MLQSPNQKQISIVSRNFFKQFCLRKELIVLGKEMSFQYKQRLQNKHLILLRDFLFDNTFITSINLSYNKITSEGLKTLADILVRMPHINELILSNNNIDGEGIKYLVAVKSAIGLECLRLNGNKLKEEYGHYLIQFLSNNKVLKYLDLGETDLTNDMFNKMAPAIISSKLVALVISSIIGYNSKTYDTATIVRYIFTKNNLLSMLYLRKLQLSDSDVETICSGFKTHPGLKLLDLSCNNISDIGGGYIVRYLGRNMKMEGLFLSHNRISDGTSYSLSCIVPASNISMLDVSYNSISDNGLVCLLDILQPGYGLCILLWGNSIGPKCCVKFKTLYENGKMSNDKIDVTVGIDESNNIAIDHNPTLDKFRVNYYSIRGRKQDLLCATFPFHKITLANKNIEV